MEKKQVVILMGGMSSEHEVSLASGATVTESLNRTRYAITPVTITRDGLWQFPGEDPVDIYQAVPRLKRQDPDCVFIALHGAFGEDGRLQGMLDLLSIPYTSSGCIASGLAMDKIRAKAVVRDAGIRVPEHLTLDIRTWQAGADAVLARVTAEIGFPCVLKSPCQGSSVGLDIPRDPEEFRAGIGGVFEYGDVLMIERYVTGREVTCAVLDVDAQVAPRALPVTEIRPVSSSYFDYYAKYTPGASEEITPAEISPELTTQVRDYAVRAHQAVGCGIWSRSDMIIDADGPVWIEINTVPGLTPTSLYPQAAAAVGIPYGELLDMFVEAAMARGGGPKKGQSHGGCIY
jgi:D-alanine-D-alanine ligase